jgi:protein KRI1
MAFRKKIGDIAGLKSGGKKGAKPNMADEDAEEDARVAALLSQKALEEDFDPETFDKQMNALFNDDYYNAIDDNEVAILEEEDADFIDSDDEGDEVPGSNAPAKPHQSTRRSLKSKDVPEALMDEADLLYPTQTIAAAVSRQTHKGAQNPGLTAQELEAQLEEKMDEYWRLHYHTVAGGVRTRFKYRDVNQERFGLNDEDILMMDDRTLNMIAPFNSYATYLNRQQNMKDRFKAMHRRKNIRTLNPERQSRRYKTNTVVVDPDRLTEEEGIRIAAAARRLNVGTADDVAELIAKADADDVTRSANIAEKRAVSNTEPRAAPHHNPQKRGRGNHGDRPNRKGHFTEGHRQPTSNNAE